MGKMKDLAIRIDEIMEKIEESLDGLDKMNKIYIYNNLSIRCNLRAERLTDQLADEMIETIHKNTIKENEDDK